MRRLLFAIAVLALLAGSAPAVDVIAQDRRDTEQDAQEALAAAEEILALAAARKFNAMYDLIHPDAHAVIPRVAAVGTFEDLYSIAEAGRAEITDISFGTWTWGVTGETYEHTAQIAFEQPYVENGKEKILEDTMYLVEYEGEWRWFFGATPEFVDAAIERYMGETGEPLTEGDLVQNVVEDLDVFYQDVLSYTEYTYQSPGVVVVERGGAVNTACGPAQSGFWAFYCPPDQTIYLDEPLLETLQEQADFAAAFVIAHEWAHHIQTGVGIRRTTAPDSWNELYSIQLELMADCLSGAWARDVGTRNLLEPDDIEETMAFTVENLGDPAYIDEYDPQAHGSAQQRVDSFMNGYEQGFLGCNVSV